MPLAIALPRFLLQAITVPDTIIARTIPERGVLDWTNGILQMLVLVLAVGALIALILLLLAMREGVKRLNGTVDKLAADTKPLLANATAISQDAREMVAMIRGDVERLTDAAGAVSDQLLEAAEVTAQRVDDVNAVLDVLQAELEDTAIGAVAAIRGVREGTRALTGRRPRRRPRRAEPDAFDDED
jgi:methyl-accepting chemotaxis protein